MNDIKQYVLGVVMLGVVFLAALAYGQQQSLILGNDPATDGGIMRRVQVDSQGRLVTSGSSGTSTDAGVAVRVSYCSATQDRNTAVGTAATTLPVFAGRWLTRVCNSARNSGTPIITCSTDGTSPDAGLNGVGEALEVGDCATYTTGSAITCISDTALTSVSSHDCR